MIAPEPIIRKRRRRRARQVSLWPIALLVALAVVAGAVVWSVMGRVSRPAVRGLEGYVDNADVVEQQYNRLYNRPLSDPLVRQDFRYAGELVSRRDYAGAIPVLERITKQASVPVVLNNLGVLYAIRNDNSRAVNAFRAAFARDGDYQPVRANLARLKAQLSNVGAVTEEIEPNDSYLLANLVDVGKPVDAEISAYNDTDCFRFVVPPPPRDIIAIEVENLSKTLTPALSVFDSDDRFLGWTKNADALGDSLEQRLTIRPNTTLIVHVWGYVNTLGKYRITMRALKAYDRYEPNDDILNPTSLTPGQTIQAGIMDSADTDFYSFVAPDSGSVRVEIKNRSTTLIPALTKFAPDRSTIGFGPDVRTGGADLHDTFEVKPKQVYFIQVWSQGGTSGAYELTVR
jgi:hypothetical protein